MRNKINLVRFGNNWCLHHQVSATVTVTVSKALESYSIFTSYRMDFHFSMQNKTKSHAAVNHSLTFHVSLHLMYQLNTQTVHNITTVTLHPHHNDSFQQYRPSLKPTEANWITFNISISSVYSVAEKKHT